MVTCKKLLSLILTDLYRYERKTDLKSFLLAYYSIPAFHFLVWLRCTKYFRQNHWLSLFYPILAWRLHLLRIRYGLSIFSGTIIGDGFFIGHIGGIVINGETVIGNNCTILHGVTLGSSDRKDKPGAPILGNYVYVGAGAKILGNVKVEDHAVIGANCVVTRNVPENAVVVGVPGKIVSKKGSYDLIINEFLEDIY